MKAGKLAGLCGWMGVLSLVLGGCQNPAQTQEEIVVPRQERGTEQQEALPEGAEGSAGKSGQAAGAIAEQVQAPERYVWEGGSDKVSVKADAALVIPQAEGFQSYKVTGRVFTQEDYDNVNRVLLNGEKLFERDYEAMAGSHGFTAEEIEGRIAELEAQKARYEAGGKAESIYVENGKKTYDELLAEWGELLKNAPEVSVIVEKPAIVSHEESAEYLEENTVSGTASVDGKDFFVYLDNNWRDDWRWINFGIEAADGNSNFVYGGLGEGEKAPDIPIEEVREKAQKAVEEMGFSDFVISGEEYFHSFSADESRPEDGTEIDGTGYGVTFTRSLGGIPVTYTHEFGTTVEDESTVSWPYEYLCMVYTQEGLASFRWDNPYEVEKTSEEYVFLLPFSEIQTIFQEMIVKKYEDFFEGSEDVKIAFDIDEVRLGYMRIMEKGNAGEGKMVPVWDFFGKETVEYPEASGERSGNRYLPAGVTYVQGGPYDSWLTINALDGTIIDRGLGY